MNQYIHCFYPQMALEAQSVKIEPVQVLLQHIQVHTTAPMVVHLLALGQR